MNALSMNQKPYTLTLANHGYKSVIFRTGEIELKHDNNRPLRNRDFITAGLTIEQAAKAACEIYDLFNGG